MVVVVGYPEVTDAGNGGTREWRPLGIADWNQIIPAHSKNKFFNRLRTMYEEKVRRVRCFPDRNSGSSNRLGLYATSSTADISVHRNVNNVKLILSINISSMVKKPRSLSRRTATGSQIHTNKAKPGNA